MRVRIWWRFRRALVRRGLRRIVPDVWPVSQVCGGHDASYVACHGSDECCSCDEGGDCWGPLDE
jgi:hypothetical protein